MESDPIVDEVRKARQEHARKFGYKIHDICADLKGLQKKLAPRVVSLPPKRIMDRTGT